MTFETKFFEIAKVDWSYPATQEIPPRPNPSQRILDAMTVRCKGCGAQWRATAGNQRRGQFQLTNGGGAHLVCRDCSAEEMIPAQLLGY